MNGSGKRWYGMYTSGAGALPRPRFLESPTTPTMVIHLLGRIAEPDPGPDRLLAAEVFADERGVDDGHLWRGFPILLGERAARIRGMPSVRK